jgi:hypothetical protein
MEKRGQATPALIPSPEQQVLEQGDKAPTTNVKQYQVTVMIKINTLVQTASNLENAPVHGTLYVVRVELVKNLVMEKRVHILTPTPAKPPNH